MSLETFVDHWSISESSGDPLAIIAGYGMGKTSFARHLAFRMASRCLAGKQSRVPILLSLGAISREQSIEGLLGATLTGSRPFV
jgi:predicted NACHT family NTPase